MEVKMDSFPNNHLFLSLQLVDWMLSLVFVTMSVRLRYIIEIKKTGKRGRTKTNGEAVGIHIMLFFYNYFFKPSFCLLAIIFASCI